MLITAKLLKKMKAGPGQVELFQKLYPQGIDILEDSVKAQKVYDEAGKVGLNIQLWLENMKLTGIAKWWYPDGEPECEIHYQRGKLQDPENGTAAVKWWYSNGKLKCEIHYQNGKLQDSEDGTAAEKRWDSDGKPEYEPEYEYKPDYDYQNGVE